MTPPNFKVFDYYPDGTNGDWSATGVWNDDMCAPKPPATPVTVGFGNGAWFPYKKTKYMYPVRRLAGLHLSRVRPRCRICSTPSCGSATSSGSRTGSSTTAMPAAPAPRAYDSDIPQGTVSEGQGYGIAIAAAIGDKDLVDKLWEFVRHYRSQTEVLRPDGLDLERARSRLPGRSTRPATDDSAFDGDVDIAIGLVYAALQWPEYTDIAVVLAERHGVRGQRQVRRRLQLPDRRAIPGTRPTATPTSATTPRRPTTRVYIDYYPPGYFRVFGDFLAAKLGSDAKASNGQTYHDFWYKTAETVWEMVERCYDQAGVHPGLMGNSGDIIDSRAAHGGGEPYEWGRALWRLGIDAAWFGNNTSLPENKPNSSPHYAGKSRIQAKMDNIQDFYTNFYKKNPPEPNANRFSTICHQLGPDGRRSPTATRPTATTRTR